MPPPPNPTPDVAISPLDPTYIPFTTDDPTATNLKIEDLPQKEPIQYRNIIEKLRAKLLIGSQFLPQAFAYSQTGENNDEADTFTIVPSLAPVLTAVTGGIKDFNVVIWTPPVDPTNAGTINDYIIEASTDSFATVLKVEKTISVITSIPNVPVSIAGTYSVRIRAINEVGIGAASNVIAGVVVT